jgi:LmbE family N-acetylglucosaminyl deacetylase
MKEKKKVLVISVHPDDETLGCGGSILKHLGQGDEVHCVFITGGNIYQRQLIDNINALYGFTSIITLDFKELHLHEMLNELIEALSKIVSIVQAQVLYIPNRSDAHSDHRAVFSAIMACSKNFRYPFIEQILMCEVISETDFAPILGENTFSPNYFIDISDINIAIQSGEEVIASLQMLPYPMTRNQSAIEALNRYRGTLINAEYAEAFMSIKTIVR